MATTGAGPGAPVALAALAARWRDASPSERANAQLYLAELCDALGVEKPRPAGTGYEFEYPVRIVHRDGSEAHGRIDLFREGCFLLEAKDDGAAPTTTSTSSEMRVRRAFGQASTYAAFVRGGAPPYLLAAVCDRLPEAAECIGRCVRRRVRATMAGNRCT
jgi:hypothetical protein